jgi:hypothetical protein
VKRTPTFGTRVLNTVASESNPHRTGLFVEVVTIPRGRMNAGRWWRLTDGRGKFWKVRPEFLELITHTEQRGIPDTPPDQHG